MVAASHYIMNSDHCGRFENVLIGYERNIDLPQLLYSIEVYPAS